MDRTSHNGVPTLFADTKRLRQELEQLYASVKGSGTERRDGADQAGGVGMVIKGK